MPVINLDMDDLSDLMGKKLDTEDLIMRIPMIGADAGTPEGKTLPVEFFPDRPDMFSVEGAARALRYFLATDDELMSMPLPDYPVKPSGITMTVDPSVCEVRPFVVGAVVRNVTMSDPLIQSLMDHQEKLHITVGRKRVKAAIGVHDLSKVTPPFRYTTENGDRTFIPLLKDHPMSLDQILQRHEKGVAYAHILEGKGRYPIIYDKEDEVLSFPPIINGILTAVTEETTDIFIDITGMELRPITMALNILSTAFAERGATIESVEVVYHPEHEGLAGKTLVCPDLGWKEKTITVDSLNDLLNTELNGEDWILPFKRMGLRAEPSQDGTTLTIAYPAYRADILHDWDIFEDGAIGFGYQNIPETAPKIQTTGGALPIMQTIGKFQRTMVGFGYSEVKSLTLVGERDGYHAMDLPVPKDDIMIHNPITEDHTRLRTSLIPPLLSILRANRHRDLPQQIFEPGIVLEKGCNVWKGVGLATHSKAGFTEMKSLINSLIPVFGLEKKSSIRQKDHPSFVHGRCAEVVVDGNPVGVFGELHPKVITSFELEYPVIAFELSLQKL